MRRIYDSALAITPAINFIAEALVWTAVLPCGFFCYVCVGEKREREDERERE